MTTDVLGTLKQVGAIITDDHIVYTSGKHGSVYVNKDALYPHVAATSAVCRELASRVQQYSIDVVAGPVLGGIILSQWVAYHLGELTGRAILSVYAEKTDDSLEFRRGYDSIVNGKSVLVVEDIINTGGSALKAVQAVRAVGGSVAAVGVMVNRSPDAVNEQYFDAPLVSLAEFPATAYEAADCPFCKEAKPVNTSVGHGKKYLESLVQA